MLFLDHARSSDGLMRATTTLTVAEFDDLARRFAEVRAALRAVRTAAGTARERRPGAGAKGCLPTAQLKLFFILAEEARLRLPSRVDLLGDSGFEGLAAGAIGTVTPWKRHGGRKLHWRKRRFNRQLSSVRINIEHTFASAKRFRILRDEFHNRRKGMINDVMVIGCTFHNFRYESRQQALAA